MDKTIPLPKAADLLGKELKGKLVQLNDGTGRSGVIVSTQGIFFPRKEATEDHPEGKYCEVKLAKRNGSYESEPIELNGRGFELALVMQ